MQPVDVFLSLGGNIGDTKKIINSALCEIGNSSGIELIKSSPLYKTTPVTPKPQRFYINCACHIQTCLEPEALLKILQEIERKLGKKPKEKSSPRIIDIDIIFFGSLQINSPTLTIPHKEWKKRLFVLKPLSDLKQLFLLPSDSLKYIELDINEFLRNFENTNNEKVSIIS